MLLNRGDGSFAPRRAYRSEGVNGSVAIGDVNGDGAPDLATDAGSVLLNRGGGDFAAGRDYGVAGFWVAIGDVNGDGTPDLVTANLVDPRPGRHSYTFILTISVRLNRGDGTFLARRESRGGRYPNTAQYSGSSVALGDLNGDGRPDLAIACCSKPIVAVLTNSGDGPLPAQTRVPHGTPARGLRGPFYCAPRPSIAPSVDLGDLDGDGKLDLGVGELRFGQRARVAHQRPRPMHRARRPRNHARERAANGRARPLPGRKIRRAYSTTVKRGRVISEKPRFGTVLPGGGKVNLVVSRGRKPS